MDEARRADPPSGAGLTLSEDLAAREEYREAERAALAAIDRDEREGTITENDRRSIQLWMSGLPEDEHPIQIASLGDPGTPPRFVIEDFLAEGQGLFLCGEEGSGKSYLAWQLAGEMTRGVPVLDRFAVPAPVRSVLIVDVEQSPEDVRIIRDEMVERGTIDVTAPIYFLDANGRAFDDPDDFVWLVRQVKAIRPDVLIIDTVTDAVSKPRDDESVSALTFLFGRFIHSEGVRAVIGLAQPRKLSGDSGRTFDSLFGSRKWKSWASASYWLEDKKLIVWKQRGSYIHKHHFPKESGERYAWVPLERPAEGPPTVVGSKAAVQMERDADRVRRAAEDEASVFRWIGANRGKGFNAIQEGTHIRRPNLRPALDSLQLQGKIENRPVGKRESWYVTGSSGSNRFQPVPTDSPVPVPETGSTAPYVQGRNREPVVDPEEDR